MSLPPPDNSSNPGDSRPGQCWNHLIDRTTAKANVTCATPRKRLRPRQIRTRKN